jgi:hypothetical protein
MRFLVTRVAADFLAAEVLAVVLFFGVTFLAGTVSHPLIVGNTWKCPTRMSPWV